MAGPDDEMPPHLSDHADQSDFDDFDIEAARARYRRTMRGPLVRTLFGLTLLILLCTWIYAGLAAWASDVNDLPQHDLSVRVQMCIDCHSRQLGGAPSFNHSFAPTCGFCHRQSLPPRQ